MAGATPNTYKNGVVAISIALEVPCRMLKKFGGKVQAIVDLALTQGVITQAQHDTATAFLSGAQALCDIFKLIRTVNGA